ncbi:MAG TPA: phosphate ABC transporter permease subunit PstC, partial [Microlunatus sp.]|nr:phosphate ABC transporter permease subunit PstC [Microlunatus sp.]
VPLGVGVALFITQYSPRWLARPAASLVDLLAAVPAIVYGLWGLWVFGGHLSGIQHVLQDTLGWFPLFSDTTVSEGGTIFVVGVVLAIMVLPIVTAISREVFAQTPVTHKEAALALGATRWEMIRTTVLPFGRPGVISASMLALGRALGETVAVLIILSALSGGTAWSWSIFNGGETFASKIANNAAEFDTPQKAGAFIAAGLVLFVLTFVVNAIARIVIERRKAFTE